MGFNVRKSQIIYPWGVGSIVAFPDGVAGIVAGLDYWYNNSNNDGEYLIRDDRLAKLLNVKWLLQPPFQIGKNTDAKVPVFAFPNWYYCPTCGNVLYKDPSHDGLLRCPEEGTLMVPERFIIACPNGHIMNLPILKLIHGQGFDEERWLKDNKFQALHKIVRKTGNSVGTEGIIYECQCEECKTGENDAHKHFKMSDVFQQKKLSEIMSQCPGSRPWLGPNNHEHCSIKAVGKENERLLVIQRGGTNVWYSQQISSIYLPSENEKYEQLVSDILEKSKNMRSAYVIEEKPDKSKFASLIDMLMSGGIIENSKNVDKNIAIDLAWKKITEDPDSSEDVPSDNNFRYEEFERLTKSSGTAADDLYVKSIPIDRYDGDISNNKYFKSVSLVPKLKETRALVGFSRLIPRSESPKEARKTLSKEPVDWVPAIQNKGEGIMIEFNQETIEHWSKNKTVIWRANKINENRKKAVISWSQAKIKPAFILLHTLSHLLINEISKECGYGSSAIRERIYIGEDEKPMYGILIYTSSSGSEGSLGGLVRLGQPGYFERLIKNAIENAKWCSADPVCIKSSGQGTDSCNLAACHNCALLPETCCENGNRYLDRGLLIGTLDNPDIGFFKDL